MDYWPTVALCKYSQGKLKMSGSVREIEVIIVGGGHAGLSVSYYLCQDNIEHLVLERRTCMHTWQTMRWDSFCLVTPNWQCRLPQYPYAGNDPDGFMVKDEIVEYLDGFKGSFACPLKEWVNVTDISKTEDDRYLVCSTAGNYVANQIVIATGSYGKPIIPPYADKLDPSIAQFTVENYKNPEQVPPGATLVVGAGQSGVQVMEDLFQVGRKVHLAVGQCPRSPREYRGKDSTKWLYEMGHYAVTIKEHPLGEDAVFKTNHYLSGRDGGHEIDLREFYLKGVSLYGSLSDIAGTRVTFDADLKRNLDSADESYVNICKSIDNYITENDIQAPPAAYYTPVWQPEQETLAIDLRELGITSLIWAIGLQPDYSWLKISVFNKRNKPICDRGVCQVPGCYFIGLSWLYTWGSARFLGIDEDAQYLASEIKRYAQTTSNSFTATGE